MIATIWHIRDNGGEARSACGGWRRSAIPEGFIVRDVHAAGISFPSVHETLELAQAWCEFQPKTLAQLTQEAVA